MNTSSSHPSSFINCPKQKRRRLMQFLVTMLLLHSNNCLMLWATVRQIADGLVFLVLTSTRQSPDRIGSFGFCTLSRLNGEWCRGAPHPQSKKDREDSVPSGLLHCGGTALHQPAGDLYQLLILGRKRRTHNTCWDALQCLPFQPWSGIQHQGHAACLQFCVCSKLKALMPYHCQWIQQGLLGQQLQHHHAPIPATGADDRGLGFGNSHRQQWSALRIVLQTNQSRGQEELSQRQRCWT